MFTYQVSSIRSSHRTFQTEISYLYICHIFQAGKLSQFSLSEKHLRSASGYKCLHIIVYILRISDITCTITVSVYVYVYVYNNTFLSRYCTSLEGGQGLNQESTNFFRNCLGMTVHFTEVNNLYFGVICSFLSVKR